MAPMTMLILCAAFGRHFTAPYVQGHDRQCYSFAVFGPEGAPYTAICVALPAGMFSADGGCGVFQNYTLRCFAISDE